MKFVCEITFYWEGKTWETSVIPKNPPLNKTDAETIAWMAIRRWFEERHTEVPEFVRNVQVDDVKEYQWDILPLTASNDTRK